MGSLHPPTPPPPRAPPLFISAPHTCPHPHHTPLPHMPLTAHLAHAANISENITDFVDARHLRHKYQHLRVGHHGTLWTACLRRANWTRSSAYEHPAACRWRSHGRLARHGTLWWRAPKNYLGLQHSHALCAAPERAPRTLMSGLTLPAHLIGVGRHFTRRALASSRSANSGVSNIKHNAARYDKHAALLPPQHMRTRILRTRTPPLTPLFACCAPPSCATPHTRATASYCRHRLSHSPLSQHS